MTDRPTAANDWQRAGGVNTSVLIRRGLFVIVALLSLGALSLAALPWIASTQLVRNRIAIELSAWSGFRVAIASTPQIEVFPTFKAVLAGVTLYQWGDWDNPAVIEAERVEINLSALEALNGNVVLSEMKLVNPVVRLGSMEQDSGPEIFTSSGRIAQAIETTRDLLGDDPDKPDFARFPTTPFGTVEFSNGRVVQLVDGKQQDLVTRLSGKVDWPALNAAGNFAVRGTWRGEEVDVSMSSASPLALLAGGATTVNAKLTSKPFTVSYEGEVRRADAGRIAGAFKLDMPSVRRAIAWTDAEIATGSAIGSLALESRVTGDKGRLELPDLQLNIDDAKGSGSLMIEPAKRPQLGGALAFDTLDLHSFVSLFTPLMSYDRPADDVAGSIIEKADFNLEVSVAKATLNERDIADMRGRATSSEGVAVFQIDQSSAFGGKVNGAFTIDRRAQKPKSTIRMNAVGIDGTSFGTASGFARISPAAKGDVAFMLSGTGASLDTMMSYADGTVSAHFGSGYIENIDLEELVSRTVGGGFFPLSEIEQGSLQIDRADLEATVVHGVGRIQQAEIRAGPRIIFLSGILPYAGRGVALSGTIASRDKVGLFNPNGREASFFVGGSWDAPFVSAALPPRTLQ